jgi:hypothetical protein
VVRVSTALRATGETLQAVLLESMRADPALRLLFTPFGAATVSLSNPDEMAAAGETGISLWLYRVMRDDQRLNTPPERIGSRLRPTPLPMLGADMAVPPPETQQHVLGAVLQTFHERPLLAGVLLAGDHSGTSVELALRLESLTIEELGRLWDSLEHPFQLSLSYEVGVVAIRSTVPDSLGPPVTVLLSEYGVATPVVA